MSAGELAGERVVVVGLGVFGGGLGAARWALSEGAEVVVTDLRGARALAESIEALEERAREAPPSASLRFTLGRHDGADLDGARLVIANPAVPPDAPFLGAARERGARVTTATEILLGRLGCRCVGVTGTNGKTSTVRFIEGLLRASLPPGVRVAAGGNIGGSLLDEADSFERDDVAVLELSSYQLEYLAGAALRPLDAAVVTNIGVDHLARHGTLERYRGAKLALFGLLRPGGAAVTDASVSTEEVAARTPGGAEVLSLREGGALRLDGATGEVTLDGERLGDASDLRVPGAYQRANLALALAAARRLGAPAHALAAAVPGLTAAPHRLEALGRFDGPGGPLRAWDNGVSTTPESTLAALEWLQGRRDGPAVLLAGGRAKAGQDFGALTRFASQNGWSIVGFGEHGAGLDPSAEGAPRPLATAVAEAARRAAGGDLLFSPACASFDAYPNFKARAEDFRAALRATAAPIGSRSETDAARIIDGPRTTT